MANGYSTFQECLGLLAKGGLWKVKHASITGYSLVPSSSHYQLNCVLIVNFVSFVYGCYGNSWSWILAGNLRRCVAVSEDPACLFDEEKTTMSSGEYSQ